jgi:serine protease inhibitor ecotin
MQIIGRDCVYYFHDMIVEMIKWGFQEGKTLFGFGYDFRQSNRCIKPASFFQYCYNQRVLFSNEFCFTMYGDISFPLNVNDFDH